MKWLENVQRSMEMARDVDLNQLAEDSGYRRAIVRTLARDTDTIPRAMQNRMEALGLDIGRRSDGAASIMISAMRVCGHCNLYERCLVDTESYLHLCPNAARFEKLLEMEATGI